MSSKFKKMIKCLITFSFIFTIVGCGSSNNKNTDKETNISSSVDELTGLPLVDYFVDNDEADQISYDLYQASVQTNYSEDLTILDGYGVINENNIMKYFITAVQNDEGEKMVFVSDLDNSRCRKTEYFYFDDPKNCIFYATDTLNKLRGYSIYRPDESELEDITGL